jgi:hypothetical protein
MSVAGKHGAHEQCRLVERWVASLARLPAVEVIWLEGSLVDDRANPWSDVDLRIALADDVYAQLWETDRTPLLEGLGEYLRLWNKGFVRAVTAEGIVVELAARKVSELFSQELYEWRILLNRLPGGPPQFKQLPKSSAAESWPGSPVSIEDVSQRTRLMLHYMTNAPQDFYSGEVCAAAYTLDCLRHELFEVMYQRLGIRFGKRNKELSRIFPAEFIADLKSTYTETGQSALDRAAIAAAQIRTLSALGKHLEALSDQVGGGFEPEWYPRLLARMKRDLSRLVGGEAGQAA